MSILDEFVCGVFFCVKNILFKSFTLRGQGALIGRGGPSLKAQLDFLPDRYFMGYFHS
jgi:hypothetical protein